MKFPDFSIVMPGLDPGIQQKIRAVLISDGLPGQARQ
jgi:hypothetical protein